LARPGRSREGGSVAKPRCVEPPRSTGGFVHSGGAAGPTPPPPTPPQLLQSASGPVRWRPQRLCRLLGVQTLRPQPYSSHSRCRFGCSPKIPTKNKRPLVDGFVSGGKMFIFPFPFRLRRSLNRYRLRSFTSSDCPRRCPPLRRYRLLRRRVFWLPAPLLLLLLWTSCL